MPGGRPTDYRPEFCEAIQKLEGAATNTQIADSLGISLGTLWNWKEAHPEFMIAIKNLKDRVDDRVESALYNSAANGGVPVAQIFWLKNRRRDEWKDRNTLEGSNDAPLSITFKSILDKE